jgi:hypothetical protein
MTKRERMVALGTEAEQEKRMGIADAERMWVANESEGARLKFGGRGGFIVVEAKSVCRRWSDLKHHHNGAFFCWLLVSE